MELRTLRYFLGIMKEKNITRAAEQLNTTQPNLTRQIRNLEAEIGKPLFVRGRKELAPTETALLLQKRAREILDLYEKTEKEMLSRPETLVGDVCIGTAESHTLRLLAKAVKTVQDAYPSVRFRIISGDIEEISDKLNKGLLDFGILVNYGHLSQYECCELPEYDIWGVLMKSGHPLSSKQTVSKEDLINEPLICSRQSLEEGLIGRWFGLPTEKLDIRATYNLIYNASLLVAEGVGSAIGLDRLISADNGNGLCFRPLAPSVTSPLCLVRKKYALLSPAASVFWDTMLSLTDGSPTVVKTGKPFRPRK